MMMNKYVFHVARSLGLSAALALILAAGTPARAQFATQPNAANFGATYRAAITGLVTAASATDFLTIQGAANKTIYVTSMGCSGIGSTAGTADIQVIKRSVANTTGTSTTLTNVPLDSSIAAGAALVKAYTVNPGALGAAVGPVASFKLGLPLAATGSGVQQGVFNALQPRTTSPVVLRGVAQTLALNGNAATLAPGASLNCSVEWSER